MYEISDERGNRFFVKTKELGCKILNEKENPFVNMFRCTDHFKVDKNEIVKSYADFCVYFY